MNTKTTNRQRLETSSFVVTALPVWVWKGFWPTKRGWAIPEPKRRR